MSTGSSEISLMNGSPFQNIMDKFRNQCEEYFDSEMKKRFFTSSTLNQTITNHYLTEYQRCIDEQNHFENYIHEQINSLESLKSCETAIDSFVERLKTVHDYESKQNEVFEQILHELTKMNPSSKEERIELIQQIDHLIVMKSKLMGESNPKENKLLPKSSDTFKNIL